MTFEVKFVGKINRKYIQIFSIGKPLFAICVLAAALFAPAARAQRLNPTFLAYIDRYKDAAISGAQQFGVPASITLAQGLLESGAGQSNLARKAHNHFGIKCHRSWQGERITVGDSSQAVCYRSYAADEDSYLDHARFLQGKRYASLYELDPTDYKGWARGLQRCGYAENPTYAQLLIGIIERYGLSSYDAGQPQLAQLGSRQSGGEVSADDTPAAAGKKHGFLPKHYLHRKWGLHYVLAESGDTYQAIAAEFSLKASDLRGYNDIDDRDAVPAAGDMVWVEAKAKAAPARFEAYTVRPGDTMWLVAQTFGLRLKSLASLNGLKPDAPIEPGQRLRLQ